MLLVIGNLMHVELKAIASGEVMLFNGSADILAIHLVLCAWYQCHQGIAAESQEAAVSAAVTEYYIESRYRIVNICSMT